MLHIMYFYELINGKLIIKCKLIKDVAKVLLIV